MTWYLVVIRELFQMRSDGLGRALACILAGLFYGGIGGTMGGLLASFLLCPRLCPRWISMPPTAVLPSWRRRFSCCLDRAALCFVEG